MATSSKPTGSNWSQLLAALRQLDEDERSGKVRRPRQMMLLKSLPSEPSASALRARAQIDGFVREARRLALEYSKPLEF